MLYKYRGRLTAVLSKGQKLFPSNEGFGKAREKDGGWVHLQIRLILLRGGGGLGGGDIMTRLWTSIICSYPIIRLWQREKNVFAVFLPLQGHLCYARNNSGGQNTPGSRSTGVPVTSLSLQIILFPSPPKMPALLWPSALGWKHTHILFPLLCVCITMLCSSLGTCTCMVHFPVCLCVCMRNFLKVTFCSSGMTWWASLVTALASAALKSSIADTPHHKNHHRPTWITHTQVQRSCYR